MKKMSTFLTYNFKLYWIVLLVLDMVLHRCIKRSTCKGKPCSDISDRTVLIFVPAIELRLGAVHSRIHLPLYLAAIGIVLSSIKE